MTRVFDTLIFNRPQDHGCAHAPRISVKRRDGTPILRALCPHSHSGQTGPSVRKGRATPAEANTVSEKEAVHFLSQYLP